MTPQNIDVHWRSTYPECEPIQYLLRDAYRSRWVRFHSLPGSKRYADNKSEYQIILDRHNAVLGELATPSEALVLVTTGCSSTSEPSRDDEELDTHDPAAQCWRTIAKHKLENDDQPNYWHLFMSVWQYMPSVFDPVLRLIADDVVANTMIVSTTNRWVYHPYDGGADVILDTTTRRDTLKARFKSWCSSRSDGL